MMRPTSQSVPVPIRSIAPAAVDDLLVKIADTEDEIEQVHRLNYDTFVEEIGQHPPNADGRLVDAHHSRNIYFVAKKGPAVIGMICLTSFDGVSFSIEKRLPDPRVIDQYRPEAIEIRLLAVRKDTRASVVFGRLAHALAEYAIGQGYRYGLISGITTREPLYRRFGFQAIGDPVPSGAAEFVPMVVGLDRFLAYARQSRGFVGQEGVQAFRPEEPPILLTPGPVSVHPAVITAMSSAAAGLHHRTAAFVDLVAAIETLLRSLFKVPDAYAIAMLGTSGTGSVEAMVRLASALPRPRVLVLSNGHFGDRLKQIAESVGVEHQFHWYGADTALDLDLVRRMLRQDGKIGSVLTVHMETSLGQFNDLRGLDAMCREQDVTLFVDMVSSLGGERFDFTSVAPPVAVSVSGKALAAFPGVAIAFVRRDVLAALRTARWSHYLDIARHVQGWNEQRSVPFTLPVTLFPPLHQALVEIEREGVDRKIERHERTLRMLESWLLDAGFTPVPVVSRSSTTRTFQYAPGQEEAFDRLMRRTCARGYLCYQNPHYHRPARQFQVSTMGWINAEAVEALVKTLGKRRR